MTMKHGERKNISHGHVGAVSPILDTPMPPTHEPLQDERNSSGDELPVLPVYLVCDMSLQYGPRPAPFSFLTTVQYNSIMGQTPKRHMPRKSAHSTVA